jgi:dTDP-4-dehydrorhamnose reductase
MAGLAERGVSPAVVDDQHGRLTFTAELARGIRHLLESEAPFGTYNLSNAGPTQTWADIAAEVFRLSGRDPADVTRVSTATYAEGKDLAPRPVHSTLRLDKITAAGFRPEEAGPALRRYLAGPG